MPHHSDFDKVHSALMGMILFIFPHRGLPRIGTWRHSPCDGVLIITLVEVRIVIAEARPIQLWHQYIVETG